MKLSCLSTLSTEFVKHFCDEQINRFIFDDKTEREREKKMYCQHFKNVTSICIRLNVKSHSFEAMATASGATVSIRSDSGAQCRFIEHWPWAKQPPPSPFASKKWERGGEQKNPKTKSGEKKPVDSTENMSELNNVLSITIRHSEFQRNPNWKWKRTWTADSNSRATMMY